MCHDMLWDYDQFLLISFIFVNNLLGWFNLNTIKNNIEIVFNNWKSLSFTLFYYYIPIFYEVLNVLGTFEAKYHSYFTFIDNISLFCVHKVKEHYSDIPMKICMICKHDINFVIVITKIVKKKIC